MILSKLTVADEEAYVDFLQKAYRDQFNSYRFESRAEVKKFWRWEYLDNPQHIHEKPLIWVCRSGDNIVGQLCVMPVKVKLCNGIYQGGWCQDFMVLPDFRGKGIGQKLVHEVKNGLHDTMDVVMAVIATENSRAIFRKEGFTEVGEVNKNVAVTAASNILLSIRRFGARRSIEVQEANISGGEFNHLWECLSKKFDCLIMRDAETLNWRFAPQRYWTYRAFIAKAYGVPKGYVIVKEKVCRIKRRQSSNTGIIADIFFDPAEQNIGRTLIETALHCIKGTLPVVRCDAMNPSVQKLLKSAGFITIKSANRFLLYLSERVAKEDIVSARKKCNWYITYGDSDLDLS